MTAPFFLSAPGGLCLLDPREQGIELSYPGGKLTLTPDQLVSGLSLALSAPLTVTALDYWLMTSSYLVEVYMMYSLAYDLDNAYERVRSSVPLTSGNYKLQFNDGANQYSVEITFTISNACQLLKAPGTLDLSYPILDQPIVTVKDANGYPRYILETWMLNRAQPGTVVPLTAVPVSQLTFKVPTGTTVTLTSPFYPTQTLQGAGILSLTQGASYQLNLGNVSVAFTASGSAPYAVCPPTLPRQKCKLYRQSFWF